jgi:hypothetical protein
MNDESKFGRNFELWLISPGLAKQNFFVIRPSGLNVAGCRTGVKFPGSPVLLSARLEKNLLTVLLAPFYIL